MGLLTITGAVAPAALAAEDTAPASPSTPATQDEESAPAAPVLTPSPTPATTTPAPTTPAPSAPAANTPSASTPAASAPATMTPATPAPPVAASVTPPGAHYGTGKLSVGLTASDFVPTGQPALDLTGAQLELAFSVVEGAPSSQHGTCTYAMGSCSFPPGSDLPGDDMLLGVPEVPSFLLYELPENSQFTLTLVTPPTSGQLLFDPAAKPVQRGYTTTYDPMAGLPGTVRISAPTSHRPVGVTLAGSSSLAGATVELCTVRGGDCDGDGDVVLTETTDATGTADFDGRYAPGDYQVVQTTGAGGQAIDPTPYTLTVPAAFTLAERDTRYRQTLGEPVDPPVTVPVDTPSTPAPTAPSVNEVAEQSLAAGKEQTISIGGFQPFEMVHGVLHSTPVDLGTVQADANGVATFTFTVPAGLETGTHSVTMEGLTSGIVGTATFTVTAAAAAEGTGGLAYTGADVLPLVALGGGLLAAGAGAVTVANRRRSA